MGRGRLPEPYEPDQPIFVNRLKGTRRAAISTASAIKARMVPMAGWATVPWSSSMANSGDVFAYAPEKIAHPIVLIAILVETRSRRNSLFPHYWNYIQLG
jgi:hypothetical protein